MAPECAESIRKEKLYLNIPVFYSEGSIYLRTRAKQSICIVLSSYFDRDLAVFVM